MEAEWQDSLSQDPKNKKTMIHVFQMWSGEEKSTWGPTEKQKIKKIQSMVWAVHHGASQRESESQKQDRLSKFQSYVDQLIQMWACPHPDSYSRYFQASITAYNISCLFKNSFQNKEKIIILFQI